MPKSPTAATPHHCVLGAILLISASGRDAHAVDPQNAALLSFKREQIAMVEAQREYYLDGGERLLEILRARAAQLETLTGDASNPAASLQERAYFAPDGSAQPYWIALPAGYSPLQKYPLVVWLHGYSEAVSKLNPGFPAAEIVDEATRRGLIMAVPYGRRNSDFVQWGQDDVLRVKNEVAARYAVDEKRILLAGASMGGFGASAIALHNPAPWRAVAPICARSDFYLWFAAARAALPAWKRALYDADDPRFLISNAGQTPFLLQHGALDLTVPVEHSRRLFGDAQRLNLPWQYLEDPNGDHNLDFQLSAAARAFEWFSKLPAPNSARALQILAVDPREAKNDWASIDAFEIYGQKARLEARFEADTLQVALENVASFTLTPPPALWNGSPSLKLRIGGALYGIFGPDEPIHWKKDGARLEKTALRSGPFKSLLRDPFLLVYGDPAGRRQAEKFALEWKLCADGDAPLKAATEISDADKANYQLILFGTRETNPLLGEIAAQLPLEITPEGYRSGKNRFAGRNLGLRMVWKSPWNSKRLIGVCSGAWWGEKLPLNHKWDLIPDYIVYGAKTESDDTNAAFEAGFFDGNWAKTTGRTQ